ncbi:MAG: branched-chain amino acid ABC transporter permease [Actinomycetota bacterium]|nr:branched-chain amino acid ABC transporter permease [Actinomycetota bacterium]
MTLLESIPHVKSSTPSFTAIGDDSHVGRGVAVALVALVAIGLMGLPVVADDYLLRIVGGAAILAIATMGFNVTFGAAGQINLAIAAFFGVGAYTTGLLATRTDVPSWIACLLGMTLAGLSACLVAIPTSRLRGLYLAMATLALNQAAIAFAVHATSITNGSIGISSIPRPYIAGGAVALRDHYYLIVAIGFLVFILMSALLRSRPGRASVAVREDEVLARSLGIRARHYKVATFVIGSVVASLAGSLYAQFYGFISPGAFDVTLSIQILSMAVIGGLGSTTGAVIGAFVIALLPPVIVNRLPDDTLNVGLYESLIYAVAVFVVLLWAPRGIVGMFDRASGGLASRLRREGT